MFRNVALAALYNAILLSMVVPTHAGQYGTAEEAKAMLDRAVTAVKEDKTKALEMFNSGEGGFKDRDLYVMCANASDGIITASPTRSTAQGLCSRERGHADGCRRQSE